MKTLTITLYKIILYVNLLMLLGCTSNNQDQAISENILPKKGLCAHRGAMDSHPENTISAFQEAIRLSAHMIEFDVRLTKDHVPIIMHDQTVDRTTNGTGEVTDLEYLEIRELDCGSWKSEKFKGEKIPTLSEVLEIMPKNIWLNIHLKGGENLGKITAQKVIEAGMEHQAIIACEKEALKGVKNVSEKLKICNMERQGDRPVYIKSTINNNHDFIQLLKRRDTEGLPYDINMLKSNNIKINYYGSDSENEIRELFRLGIDFILVNQLSSSMKIAESAGIAPMIY